MPEFDAEAYLRAVGERWEPEDHEPGVLCNPVLAATAAALVAVDAITLGRAQAVIDDYSPAPAPGADRSHLMGTTATQDAASPPPDIARPRVVPCDRVIDQPWGRLTIRYVVFTDQATSLGVTLRLGESQARQPQSPCCSSPAREHHRSQEDDSGRGVLWRSPAR